MNNNKESLLLIIPAQFGYSVPHFYWCKYLKEIYNITYFSFDQGEEIISMEGIRKIEIPFIKNKVKRVINFYKSAINIITKNKYDKIIIVQYKIDFLYKIYFPFKKINYDIRTGGVNKHWYLRKIHDFQLICSSFLYNNTIILSDGLRKKLYIPKRKSSLVTLGSDVLSDKNKNFEILNLLYIGTFSGRNIEMTIDGFCSFVREYPKSMYTIIGFGDTNEEEVMKLKAKNLGIENNILFLGRKSHSEALSYFENCNVGISFVPCTSFYDDQPPTKTFEYLLSGMVCLATNTSANRSIITPNNGVLIKDTAEDFTRGLLEILKNKDTYFSDDIRSTVSGLTWESVIYNRLIPSIV